MIALELGCSSEKPLPQADVLLYNGHIRVSSERVAERMLIHEGKVIALDNDCAQYSPSETQDLNGGIILPGIHDAHTHLLAGSFVMERLLLIGVSSMSNLTQKLETYAEQNPQEPWIIGFGWLYTQLESPSKEAFDNIVSDRPIALFDSSGHNLLVNSKTLEIAGIDETTLDPIGGTIVRDENGYPTGLLKEAAIEMVSPFMLDAYNDGDFLEPLRERVTEFSEMGISSVSEILAVPGVSLARPELYSQLEEQGELPIRVSYYMPLFSIDELDEVILHEGYHTSRLQFSGLKIWVDGSTSSGSSWSLSPSVLNEENYGSHYWTEEDLTQVIRKSEENQLSIKFHTNGDAAIQTVLNAIEAQSKSVEQRYILEHVALLDPIDYLRLYELGICASVQSGIASMGRFSDQADVWGDERMERAWNFQALEEAEITTLLGTDWPVWPTIDPLVNAWTAAAGLDKPFQPGYAWDSYTNHVQECLGEAIGCLDIGCIADRTWMTSDPYQTPTEDWGDIEIIRIELAD
ncbi:MAG: hypothetical protein CL916_04345 [Deltaproteobacteria bacterium]|nr:hypothetical protein [Deltaproteobacteria bacterium]